MVLILRDERDVAVDKIPGVIIATFGTVGASLTQQLQALGVRTTSLVTITKAEDDSFTLRLWERGTEEEAYNNANGPEQAA